MEDFRIVSNYKDSDELRQSFNNLADRTFGIDFEQWYQRGVWNDRYICYSFIYGNSVVSNISINKLDLIINKKRIKALQIGTVMTDPEYCNRGLATNLMNLVLEKYEKTYDLIFLFANKGVLDFYPKFGFEQIRESRFTADISFHNFTSNKIRKLDPLDTSDLNLIMRMANERIPVSTKIWVDGAHGILGWYCLNAFKEDVYYIGDLDIIAIFKVVGDKLHLFDVLSKEQVHLRKLLGRIAADHLREIVFYFTPDFVDINPICSESEPEDVFFIKPKLTNLPECFKYPITAKA